MIYRFWDAVAWVASWLLPALIILAPVAGFAFFVWDCTHPAPPKPPPPCAAYANVPARDVPIRCLADFGIRGVPP